MNQQHCEQHDRYKMFYCIDSNCQEQLRNCCICIKRNHSNCSDEFVIAQTSYGKFLNELKEIKDIEIIVER